MMQNNKNDILKKLRELLIQNKYRELFEEMMQLFINQEEFFYNSTILLAARYYELKKQEIEGTISNENILLRYNQLRNAISKLLQDWEKEAPDIIQDPSIAETKKREAILIKKEQQPIKAVLLKTTNFKVDHKYFIIENSAIIGRDPTCQVQVNDEYISRQHTQVYIKNGIPFIKDLNSSNGTKINGIKINTPYQIKNPVEMFVDQISFSVNLI